MLLFALFFLQKSSLLLHPLVPSAALSCLTQHLFCQIKIVILPFALLLVDKENKQLARAQLNGLLK